MRRLPRRDPLARRLLRRQLRLARRRRARATAAAAHQLLGRRHGEAAGRAREVRPEHFGTNEFVRFCRLAGGEPYLAANLRSLPARDFYQWVEYCNSPAGTTTLADLRAAGGDASRSACASGASATRPGAAAATSRRRSTRPSTAGSRPGCRATASTLAFIGSGPNGGDLDWTRRFFTKLTEKGEGALGGLWGWALHHYSWNVEPRRDHRLERGQGRRRRSSRPTSGTSCCSEADRMEALITGHWAVMGEIDRRHRVKLVVDEWGAWHKPGTEVDPAHLFGQQSTMRDALVAGLTLDTFHRHADKVAMANVAQLVNCLQSLFLAHDDRFIATPTFHVFEMYAAHVGGSRCARCSPRRASPISASAATARSGDSPARHRSRIAR